MKIGNLVYEMVIEESIKSKEKFEEIANFAQGI
jgi:hypothetical protein